MASTFGKTFWGNQWLNALHHIDHSNRLPRGKSYARKGAVKNIQIKGNLIHAEVAGRTPKPYKITITVPEFSSSQKKKLATLLASKPGWLATLLNRQLPEALLREARNEGIAVFPSAWSDLGMKCSCPDFAVPCKHLASVIYLVANEIDLDPFRVLSLRGFDVQKELSTDLDDREITTEIPVETWPPDYETDTDRESPEPCELPSIDLTRIPDTGDRFLKLLPDEAPFAEGNFKNQVLSFLKSASNINRHLPDALQADTSPSFQTCRGARITISEHPRDSELELFFDDATSSLPLWDWLAAARITPQKETETWPDALQMLREYALIALELVRKSAVLPAIYQFGNQFTVLWEPLWENPEIAAVLVKLKEISPGELIKIEGHTDRGYHLAAAESLLTVCVSTLICRICSSLSKYKQDDWLHRLFFSPGKGLPADGETRKTAQSVQLWLKKLRITRHRFVPVIQVDDQNYPSFTLSLAVRETEGSGLSEPIPLKDFKEDPRFAGERLPVYQNLMLLEQQFPDISYLINHDTPHVEYNPESFEKTLLQVLPVLQDLGIEILLPKALQALVKPKPALKVEQTATSSGGGWMDLQQLLSFNWKVSIGDTFLDEKEFFELVEGSSGIVKLRDRYVHVTGTDLEKLRKSLEQPPSLSKNDQLRVLLAGEYQGTPILFSDEVKESIRQLMESGHAEPPSGLQATLRPYQISGYQWMYHNTRLGFGSILADDMGLGKTLQTISLIQKLKEEEALAEKKVLIVVPTSLISNWLRELEQFAPELSVFVYHGSSRNLDNLNEEDILITSYGILRSDNARLKKIKWRAMIIDESQNIKNPQSAQTKAVKSVPADTRIALSGTPVENRLSEYWSVFDYANKGLLGTATFFSKTFSKPIEESHDQHALGLFRKVTAPFVLRRLKSDKSIISDLPDKVENNHFCTLTSDQAALYQNVVDSVMNDIEESEGIERRGLVLKLINALKQICNHPVQYAKQGTPDPADSGKTEMLYDLLDTIIDNREKTLIFTQYTEMAEMLTGLLRERFDQEPLYLHGGLSRKNRDEQVEAFQHHRNRNIFILSLKAGGTGLNLTAASHVIHYDLWWNPAVETQATDRAYRIGQDKKVMVHRLISKGTMEEKIDAMIRSKKELAEMAVSTGENWIGELGDNELRQIVELGSGADKKSR